jgi:hypothetical protein
MGRCTRFIVTGAFAIAILRLFTPVVAAQTSDATRPGTSYAERLAAENLAIVEREDVDLTADGEPETVLVAINTECPGCDRRLLIFSGENKLADISLDAPVIDLDPGRGIFITQPVRLPDEPLCCPSGTYTLFLQWQPAVQSGGDQALPGLFEFSSSVTFEHGLLQPKAPLYSVAVYYALLDARRYEQAYNLLTSQAQSDLPFDSWLEVNRPRGAIYPLELVRVPQTSGQVRVQIEEVEPKPVGRGALTYSHRGVWQTVPVDNAWLLSMFLPED